MLFRPALSTAACIALAHAYVWPNPQLDALEAIRFDQLGFGLLSVQLATFVTPCNLFVFDTVAGGATSGRSDAADWIRTAYHDMATYNSTDQTGGLDASIRFAEEQARAENVGNGFFNTVNIVFAPVDRYISMADTIALGAVIAIENCGGPEIAFRGGRLDAGEANAPGVPQPQQSLETHVAAFARQGFTQTEMIGLVACGHTFGGVQHAFFPTIVPALKRIYQSRHSDTHFSNPTHDGKTDTLRTIWENRKSLTEGGLTLAPCQQDEELRHAARGGGDVAGWVRHGSLPHYGNPGA
ncbi:Peroxidase [Mycena sanguinolenta]|uniref:Peroxidase n=1 Tax=Mycena sanguinolenta TaxID=230812 RepID=A0A8H6Z8N2_9AGAR|nr:Peroxidase [Mycena sanguinolenta]